MVVAEAMAPVQNILIIIIISLDLNLVDLKDYYVF